MKNKQKPWLHFDCSERRFLFALFLIQLVTPSYSWSPYLWLAFFNTLKEILSSTLMP